MSALIQQLPAPARALKKSVTLTYRVPACPGNDPRPHPLTPEEAAPLIAEATVARDPYGEALLLMGDPEVVAKAREWVTPLLEMEAFLRERTENPRARQVLLERRRSGREGYYSAVRRDPALPPGHSTRQPVLPVPASTGEHPRTRQPRLARTPVYL